MLKQILKLFKGVDYTSLMQNGAVIIDVRSPAEFKQGNIKGSSNVPLGDVKSKAEKIKALDTPIILCCASGMRSGQATSMLKSYEVEAYNGGGWFSLNRKI